MKSIQNLFVFLLTILIVHVVHGQQEKLEINGAIQISNSEDPIPDPGTIRFNSNTNDFEGWNGAQWMSLTRFAEVGGGVLDGSGISYNTIKLGTQEWMIENLRTSKYNDGTTIHKILLK